MQCSARERCDGRDGRSVTMWLKSSSCDNSMLIRYGDTVIVWVGGRLMVQEVSPGRVLQCLFGAVAHDSVVGRPFGSRFQCTSGFVYLLKGTPELWTGCLPHRTQILYLADMSVVAAGLQLRSGACVLEAGTGSGSLTHSMARSLHPHGRLFSFDFHQQRVLHASTEFRTHRLEHIVRCLFRDVCSDGFPDHLMHAVDAVFLDLPNPWLVVPAARKVLRPGARIATFSPCIEQTHRTHEALRKHQFYDLTTCESLIRPRTPVTHSALNLWPSTGPQTHSAQYVTASHTPQIAGHTGFLTFATCP